MECAKCKKILEKHSKFCPNCGEKAKEIMSNTSDLEKIYEQASGCWFLLGMTYENLKSKKDEEGIKELENNLRESSAYEQYFNALAFAKNHVS